MDTGGAHNRHDESRLDRPFGAPRSHATTAWRLPLPKQMNIDQSESYSNGRPDDSPREATKKAAAFAQRAKAAISEWPSAIDAQARRNPYRAIGVALAAGTVVGIVVGSRVLRAAVASAVTYAAMELGRGYIRQVLGGVLGSETSEGRPGG